MRFLEIWPRTKRLGGLDILGPGISRFGHQVTGHLPLIGIVVHNQNRLTGARIILGGKINSVIAGRLPRDGKINSKTGVLVTGWLFTRTAISGLTEAAAVNLVICGEC